jgi:uncharacterized membrane protein (UPF0127 family)
MRSERDEYKMRLSLTGLAVFFMSAAGSAGADTCLDTQVDLRGSWGQVRFQVELADEPEERQQGLMFRREMASTAGMLFAYDREQPVVFWMRNTYLPLDLIFADGAGVVQHVHADAVPLDETLIPGGEAIQYVLEINAGLAARYGISPGTELRHPAIAPDLAAWRCE